MTPDQLSLDEYVTDLGRAARDHGIRKALSQRDPWSVAWAEDARIAIGDLAELGIVFSADDIVSRVGRSAPSPALVGALIRQAHREGLIQPTGQVVESARPSRRRGAIRTWRGTQEGRGVQISGLPHEHPAGRRANAHHSPGAGRST
jgi:hypothetical protein